MLSTRAVYVEHCVYRPLAITSATQVCHGAYSFQLVRPRPDVYVFLDIMCEFLLQAAHKTMDPCMLCGL